MSENKEETKNTKESAHQPDVDKTTTPPGKKGKKGEQSTKSKPKTSTKKIKILCDNCAGRYLLSYGKGDVVNLESKQAELMIDAGDAKETK